MSMISGKSPRWHMWAWLVGSGVVMVVFEDATGSEVVRAVVEAATAGASIGVVQATAVLLLIVVLCCWAIVAIRRLNDLGRSRWWALGGLVPIFNLALTIGLLFRPGTVAGTPTAQSGEPS